MTPDNTHPKASIVTQPLGLLQDTQKRSLQQRFEDFSRDAVEALTQATPDGEPVFVAGKKQSKMSIEVEIERVADDSWDFRFRTKIKVSHPTVPLKPQTAHFTQEKGLVIRVTEGAGHPLFEAMPVDGPKTLEELERANGVSADDEEPASAIAD